MYLLNPDTTKTVTAYNQYLHSTMYLLNRKLVLTVNDSDTYLHSTMYLLNLGIYIPFLKLVKFTFHYVSIKSLCYCVIVNTC